MEVQYCLFSSDIILNASTGYLMLSYMKYSTLNYFYKLNLKFKYYTYYLLAEIAYLTENTAFLNRNPASNT